MYYPMHAPFYNPTSMIPFFIALLFAMYAQFKVKSTFRRYSKVGNSRNISGAQAARRVLDANGLSNVQIEHVSGSLTDHYDPRSRVLRLSDSVYSSTSVSAIAVACHEVGHAVQHSKSYAPLKIRNAIVPIVNFASNLFWPLAMVGILVMYRGGEALGLGNMLLNIAIILFSCVFAFHLITLPVELDASRRALNQMEEVGIVTGEEKVESRKVLTAAAMTYIAALAMALAQLLRLLAIRRD